MVEEARVTLRKPFKSPLIRRGNSPELHSAAADGADRSPSPMHPARDKQQPPTARPWAAAVDGSSKVINASTASPAGPKSGASLKTRTAPAGTVASPRSTSPLKHAASTSKLQLPTAGSHGRGDAGDLVPPAGVSHEMQATLVKIHALSDERRRRSLRADVEGSEAGITDQERHTECRPATRPPAHALVGDGLDKLTAKWRAAAQQAAEELWEVARERVKEQVSCFLSLPTQEGTMLDPAQG